MTSLKGMLMKSKLFNEEKTFRPKKAHKLGGKKDDLYEIKVRTAGLKWSTREMVLLPQGEIENDWLAMNTVDFYNQVNVMFGSLKDICTQTSCPVMSAGERYRYYWADGKDIVKPLKCSATDYVEHLMTWVQHLLDDPAKFPHDGMEYPAEFKVTVKNIFRKLFRVYAHIYYSHFKYIESVDEDKHLNAHFKHFLFFVQEFQLIDNKELAPLSSIIEKLSFHK